MYFADVAFPSLSNHALCHYELVIDYFNLPIDTY